MATLSRGRPWRFGRVCCQCAKHVGVAIWVQLQVVSVGIYLHSFTSYSWQPCRLMDVAAKPICGDCTPGGFWRVGKFVTTPGILPVGALPMRAKSQVHAVVAKEPFRTRIKASALQSRETSSQIAVVAKNALFVMLSTFLAKVSGGPGV